MNKKEKIKIIQKIFEEEKEKNGLDIPMYTFGSITFYNSYFFKTKIKESIKKLKLYNIFSYCFLPIISGGYHRDSYNDEEIVVFYNEMKRIPPNITYLIYSAYHEIYHAIDYNTDRSADLSYDSFATQCDFFLLRNSNSFKTMIKYYLSRSTHNSMMFEILASRYGIKRTEEYIKDKNINISETERLKFEKLKLQYDYLYDNYDLTSRVNIIINNYKLFQKNYKFNDIIFKLFLNEDGSIKNINSIFSDPNVLSLDNRILYAFIKSEKISELIKPDELSVDVQNKILDICISNFDAEVFTSLFNHLTKK